MDEFCFPDDALNWVNISIEANYASMAINVLLVGWSRRRAKGQSDDD